jgi:hypothetical protein
VNTAIASPAKPSAKKVDLSSAQSARAALRTFFNLAQAWGLKAAEQQKLLGVSHSAFYEWKSGRARALDAHVLERLSHLFAIYAALHILFPLDEHANAWVRKPNPAPLFGGRSALDRMLGGLVGDLMVVRQYLDAQRGGKS